MMNNSLYQKIYDEISDFLSDFDELIIYLEYGEASYSFSFYERNGKKIIKCFDIPGVSEDDLMKAFKKIDSIVEPERDKFKEKWSNMTIVIKPDGDMKADIDYTDLSQGSYKYKKEWKKKYNVL